MNLIDMDKSIIKSNNNATMLRRKIFAIIISSGLIFSNIALSQKVVDVVENTNSNDATGQALEKASEDSKLNPDATTENNETKKEVPDEETFVELNSKELFEKALSFYKAKNYSKAKLLFQLNLEKEPRNTTLLYNLGLTEMNLKNWGWASAYWRKSLEIYPGFTESLKSLQYLEDQNMISTNKFDPIFKSSSFIGQRLSLLSIGVFFIFCFSISIRALFNFLSDKRKAFEAEESSPKFSFKFILVQLACGLSIVLLGLKLMHFSQARATIVSKTASIRLSPNLESPELLSLNEGEELKVLNKQADWTRVEDLSGTKGWIQKNNIYQTSGNN